MRKIYTAIDIGSDSIKIVVSELFNKKYYVLASTCVKSRGVKKGFIVDKDLVIECLNKAVKNIEDTIGVEIKDAIVIVPSNNVKLNITSGTVKIETDDNTVDSNTVIECLSNAILDMIPSSEELVTITPISFFIDDDKNAIHDPKGMKGEYLSVKTVIGTVPRDNVVSVMDVFNICGINVQDINFGTIGDYYEVNNNNINTVVGAVINIGSDITKVSIFNKGIMIKDDIIPLGSKNIDKDISYVYGISLSNARYLKEKFAVCSRRYADNGDVLDIKISDDETLSINQYEITEVVEARVVELLKLAKKRINDLTNKKISYIIVTGGATELTGFGYVAENILGINASILNVTTMGVRNNKYSSALGIIKCFCDKLNLKGLNYSMLDNTDMNKIKNGNYHDFNKEEDMLDNNIFGDFASN